MTKKHSTKRALLTSALSLVLCFSMLLGTTFAWFTDSVSSANNIIASGNLDIELEYWKGNQWVDVSGKSDILTNKLWEPGVTEVAYLRVKNAGTLALKYQLGINIVDEIGGTNVAGDSFLLSDYIQFGVVENVNGETGAYANREAAVAAVENAKKISAGYTKASTMEATDVLYLALVVYMPTTVGNEANYKKGTTAPRIDLGINVVATQFTSESDSFDDQYDKPAGYLPNSSKPTDVPDNGAEDILLTSNTGASVTLSPDVLPAGVEAVSLNHSNIIADSESATVTIDAMELLDQNGNAIDLSGNTEAFSIVLPAQTAIPAGSPVLVYHDGVLVADTVVNTDGTISYEAVHFCKVFVIR